MTEKNEEQMSPPYPEEWVWGIFTVGDVVKILGIARRKLLLFVEKSVVKPSVPAVGQGIANRFSVADLLKIDLVNYLNRFGVAIRHLRTFAEQLDMSALLSSACIQLTDEKFRHPLFMPGQARKLFDHDSFRVFCLSEDESGDMKVVLLHWTEMEADRDGIEWPHDRGFSQEDAAKVLPRTPVSIVVNMKMISAHVLERIRTYTQAEG